MPNPTDILKNILDKHPAAPFLFVGSGFSRRYLGTEDWVGLLTRFCEPIHNFGYYNSRANGDLPKAASLMSTDYNEWWWRSEENSARRDDFGGQIKSEADALKLDIANYISTFSLENAKSSENGDEISSFSDISVDGIITTNWDSLLDELFPDYKVFIGQQELLFSNPQAIGEIYKIHGCASRPSSMVLTNEDYLEFSARNPYLAAKLVTIFVEHPIIFLGYSIADPHIKNIITSIAGCLPQDKVDSFQNNLIFVQRAGDGEDPAVEKTTIQSNDFSVTLMVAKVSNFSHIYEALISSKRKMPARILRFFKEQLYELVNTPAETDKKLAVVDFEQIESADEVEFVVGVGVAKKRNDLGEMLDNKLAEKGYAGITADEIFRDCLSDDSQYDANNLLASAFPVIARSNRTFVPVYRYLNAIGINDAKSLEESNFEGAKKMIKKMQNANQGPRGYHARFLRVFAGLTTEEIISKSSSHNEAVMMLSFQPDQEVDVLSLKKFLSDNLDVVVKAPYRSYLLQLICRYDRLTYGF